MKLKYLQTQISADSVLAQPFATLMNAIIMKWFNQPTMRQEDVNKLIKHGLDQAKFLSMLEPISWNNVFCQELQDPNLMLWWFKSGNQKVPF